MSETFSVKNFARLRTVRHQVLVRVIAFKRRKRTDQTTLVRERPQEDTMREHQNNQPESGRSSLRGPWRGRTRDDYRAG